MFELSVMTHFSAAHRLKGYEGSCANPHGHNWEIEVFIRGRDLDKIGFLVDFRKVKAEVRSVLEKFDHCDLNTLPAFTKRNPTSENLARHVFEAISRKLNCRRYRVHRVTVCESPGSAVSFWRGE